VRRQLVRLETPALETQVDLGFLREQERQNLATGNCRCYLARDSNGAVTLFLALTFGPAYENASAVKSEYSQSLELEEGKTILQDSGMDRPEGKGRSASHESAGGRKTLPDRRNR
jgi:hypothetical protein